MRSRMCMYAYARVCAYACVCTPTRSFRKRIPQFLFLKKGGNFAKFFLLFFFRKIAKKRMCALARTLSHVLAHARAGV